MSNAPEPPVAETPGTAALQDVAQGQPIFICYRQVDGKRYARWIYSTLTEILDARHHKMPIYFDQTAPATSDWTIVHGPALERACSLVVICTPGLFGDHGKADWAHREMDWWLQHRNAPPILVDTTGEGDRWIPVKIKAKWPNAQRVNVASDLWQHAPEQESSRIRLQVAEQILGGVSDSRFATVRQDLAQARRKSRLLALLSSVLTLLLLVVLGVAWLAHRQKLIAESRALAVKAEHTLEYDQSAALGLAIRAWQTANTTEAYLAIAHAIPRRLGVIDTHAGVGHVTFSPDGKWILTMGVFGEPIQVWDANSGELRKKFDGYHGGAISPDSQWMVVDVGTFPNARIQIRNVASGELVKSLPGYARIAEFAPDGRRVLTVDEKGDRNDFVYVWNPLSGRLLATCKSHAGLINSARFSPDSKRIVIAGDVAQVWDASDGQLLLTLQGHTGVVKDAEFSPDGQRIVTGGSDKTARIWDAADGRLLSTIQGHTEDVTDAEFSPDGQRILTSSYDMSVRVWNSFSGQALVTIDLPTDQRIPTVERAAFSKNGKWIITSGTHTRVWSADTGRLVAMTEGQLAAFSPDGERFVDAAGSGLVEIWNIAATGQLEAELPGAGAAFSPDGGRIVTTHANNTAQIWNAANGELIATLKTEDRATPAWTIQQQMRGIFRHDRFFCHTSFSSDGRWILTADWDAVRLWDASDYKFLAKIQRKSDEITSATFSADGKLIVTSSANPFAEIDYGSGALDTSKDRTARVWSTPEGRPLITLQGHTDGVLNAQFSPDGHEILTASVDHTARLWNSATGQELAILNGHDGSVEYAAFSPNGQRIVTASSDKTARVWDSDGQLLLTLRGHTESVEHAEFSPDGQRIVTASEDRTARVWDSIDGRLLGTLEGGDSRVNHAEFSPDGQRIVTASEDGTAKVWNVSTGRLLAVLRGEYQNLRRASFSPDGRQIITTSSSYNAVRVYRILTLSDAAELLRN